MGLGSWLRPRMLDWAMRQMNELRPATVALAEGEVVEIGFGTGINLEFYGPKVASLVGVDPKAAQGFAPTEARVARAGFPVERAALRADSALPFESGRFDCAVSTWTLCSIPDPEQALAELRRVLRPGGRLVFVEHGRAPAPATARWQDRLDPFWTRLADGCHMNRAIDRVVEAGGFRLVSLERFRHKGPGLLAHMYRGVAERARD
jgi:SAM-dependent methyltransferase